ncbi:larval cuticle protein F1 [Dendroctonus ponderosae]|uniref:DUF4794 domain-containing protein n=2 Tax=Dendroctonus ponderosae TaxID=77166 RepID=A0AAR5PUL4_DENPD|nr:larval cuticle protein F1 [Dendroctonus ponderosae]KAH1014960.1 hypothetical protein HUJ05_012754 [Dendroctonus ponderosae]
MNTITFTAFFACLAAANAGYYSPSAEIIQGPSSKTTLIGPEGSIISAYAPGGKILHEEHPGYVAETAPVQAYAAHSPVVSYASHVPVATYAAHSPVLASAPLSLAYSAPLALGHETHLSKYGSQISHGGYAAPVSSYAAYAPVVSSDYGYYGGEHGIYGGEHGVYGGEHGLYL